MTHSLVLALFEDTSAATNAARALRALGLRHERVSIVARSHAEERVLAQESDASPGAEIEDSRLASRFGELSAYLLASIAQGLPGVGPIVAAGPLAAALGEAAGHLAGDIGRTLSSAGMPRPEAERWESRVKAGAILVGAHVDSSAATEVRDKLLRGGANEVMEGTWPD